jgi:hypothetical protein
MAFTHLLEDGITAPHQHDTVTQARECEQEAAENYWGHLDAMAELEAERRNERWFEDRGADEAYLERQWETARGVVQFEDAMAEAMR